MATRRHHCELAVVEGDPQQPLVDGDDLDAAVLDDFVRNRHTLHITEQVVVHIVDLVARDELSVTTVPSQADAAQRHHDAVLGEDIDIPGCGCGVGMKMMTM